MTLRKMMKPHKKTSEMTGYSKWLLAQDGAMAAWFALFIPVFLGISALAIDMSYAMLTRNHLVIGGKGRPTIIPCSCIAWLTSPISTPVSINVKLALDLT